MKKTWKVFVYEYLRHVLRKRFIFALLSLPLFITAFVGLALVTVIVQYDGRPIGYVDSAGWLANPVNTTHEKRDGLFGGVLVFEFPNEEAALDALRERKIQGVYLFSDDYLESGNVSLVANQMPSDGAQSAFRHFVLDNLVKDLPIEVQTRLLAGGQFNIQTLDGGRQSSNGRWVEFLIPLAAGMLFIFVVNISGGYLLRAVVEEKENRTIEIVITSISPNQLMIGKTAGNLSVGLTQLILWLTFPAAGLLILRTFIPAVADILIFSSTFWLTVAAIVPAFVMTAALMAAIGASVTEASEATTVAGWFSILLVSPYWFMSLIVQNPDAPFAIALSLFPFTAPVTLPARMVFTSVPLWQTALSLGLLYLCALGAVALAGRAFRVGMLRYGKRLTFKELFGREKKVL